MRAEGGEVQFSTVTSRSMQRGIPLLAAVSALYEKPLARDRQPEPKTGFPVRLHGFNSGRERGAYGMFKQKA